MSKDQKLRIIPIGGLGEVGKNMMAYEYNERILVVDAGLMFPDNDMLGVEYIIPDFKYLRDNSARPVIFMAGGTGFAPVKGIIEDTIARGIPRSMHLYWGVRSREDLYLHELAQTWTQRYPHIRYTPVLSDPKPSDHWNGRHGLVHLAISQDFADLSTHEIYASGSPAMVYAGRDSFSANGLSLAHYYSDAFEFAKD